MGILMQRALSPSSMAVRTKPPHEAGFTTLAVLVTLSLVSALLFGLWQQLDLNRDALLSERSYLHR
jgi:type II secretory pathway component PulJ